MARSKRTFDVPIDPLDGMLTRLQLTGIRDQLDNLLDDHGQRLDEGAGDARVAMSDHVDLAKTRRWRTPVVERPDRKLGREL